MTKTYNEMFGFKKSKKAIAKAKKIKDKADYKNLQLDFYSKMYKLTADISIVIMENNKLLDKIAPVFGTRHYREDHFKYLNKMLDDQEKLNSDLRKLVRDVSTKKI